MSRWTVGWQEFESEVRDLTEVFGYEAEATQPSNDRGVDVVARNARRKVVLQCKLYGSGKIGRPVLTQLLGTKIDFEATDAICVTTSSFTREAEAFAEKHDIYLIDKEKLISLCQHKKVVIPSLTLFEGRNSFKMYPDRKYTLGRESGSNLVLANRRISRQHAVLRQYGLKLEIRDCESSNGTFVNRKRIVTPSPLTYGDSFNLGGVLEYRVEFGR